MIWLRKGIVSLLYLVLLLSLLGAAGAVAFNNTLGKPKTVETLLSQSKLYSHFVAYTTDQAKKSAGDTDMSSSVSLSDAAVQSAAQTAFPPALIQKNINAVIDSNYAWLDGKTTTPEFKIDLTAEKDSFAQRVGQYVKTYTAGLPVCADTVLSLQQTSDLLSATCRPAVLTPEAAGTQVTEQLSSTDSFLSNPVITADNFNPQSNSQKEPYYERLSQAPKAYRLVKKLPLILGIISLICALGLAAITANRRKGVRNIGICLVQAGVIVIILNFILGTVFDKVRDKVFNTANSGQLQQSLTDFTHRLQSSTAKTVLAIGVLYLVIGAFIIIAAIVSKPKRSKITEVKKSKFNGVPDRLAPDEPYPTISRTPRAQQPLDTSTPKRRKPPRLIQ